MKKVFDLTCNDKITKAKAKQLAKLTNEFLLNNESVELLGQFNFNYIQSRQSQFMNQYEKMKFFILERLNNPERDRISIENEFLI